MKKTTLQIIDSVRALKVAATLLCIVTLALLPDIPGRFAEHSLVQVMSAAIRSPLTLPEHAARPFLLSLMLAAGFGGAALLLFGASTLQSKPMARVEYEGRLVVTVSLLAIAIVAVPAIYASIQPSSRSAGRAYRDAMTFLWPTVLMLSAPILIMARLRPRFRNLFILGALVFVLSVYAVNMDARGSRTANELVAFTILLLTVGYLAARAQAGVRAAIQGQRLAERDRDALAAEKLRYEQQSAAAITELQKVQAQLEQVQKARVRFLSAAAHDLNQPLSSVTIWAENLNLALKNGSQEEVVQFLNNLRAEVVALEKAFAAILDYATIESGDVLARLDAHRLSDIFNELERRFSLIAKEKGLRIRFDLRGNDFAIETDRDLLTRALSNLVSNAIKYSSPKALPHGKDHIVVTARRSALLTAIYVMDRGSGIPRQLLERVFEAGFQIGNDERNRARGYGLGLATVRKIFGMMGHDMRLHSDQGRGTHVSIWVPVAFGAPTEPSAAATDLSIPYIDARPLDGAMVAVVEDDENLRTAVSTWLRFAGAFTVSAGSLQEIEALVREADRKPDLILTDFKLPDGKTGVDVIDVLRSECGGQAIPALILTADPRAAIDAASGHEMVEVLKKPATARIVKVLAGWYTPQPSPLDAFSQASSSAIPARPIS